MNNNYNPKWVALKPYKSMYCLKVYLPQYPSLPALNKGGRISLLSCIFPLPYLPCFSSRLVLSCLKLWVLSPHCSQN